MAKAPTYLIHAARVIDGTGKAPMEKASVLISEGKIVYVGPKERAPAPEGVQIIDAPDLTVMPGLIDGHNGISGSLGAVKKLRCYVQYGITTAISFHGNRQGNPTLPTRDMIERGELRGCAQLVVGHAVNCTHGHNKGRLADGPWEVRKAVREMLEQGAEFIKTAASGGFWYENESMSSPNYTQEEMNALVDETHAWGKIVGVHVHTQPGLDRAIKAGADIIYHGCQIDAAAVEKMVEKGIWYIPTLKVTHPRNIAAWVDRPWMRAEMEACTDVHREGVKLAVKLGGKVAMGSDGPGTRYTWLYGENSVFEVAELVNCGMTPLQAICASTLQTAKAYRIDHRVGSLEAGKQADILCVQGNPLEDIEQLQDQNRVSLVFLKGKVEYAGNAYRDYFSIRDEDEIKPL
ncbi:amidohydrolase family protein [Paenibacillus hemerocallicola]|uniref:Amidohydrolase family protein n=1 Tax=Paenibacillus hemerocallicola TaxID=1172614 RepID=A0A5C4T7K0_9BACL|nr:amidohydrolase family protein [Paenibacillus hemerocallicola]TNJ65018.1 amidohydrolase family protein [Paenibacillus hemerocallicola]